MLLHNGHPPELTLNSKLMDHLQMRPRTPQFLMTQSRLSSCPCNLLFERQIAI